MSQIIAVAGTSHSPVLTLKPEVMWKQRAEDDRKNDELHDNVGVIRPCAALAQEAAAHLATKWTQYIPARRSEAGTGIGLAFGLWA